MDDGRRFAFWEIGGVEDITSINEGRGREERCCCMSTVLQGAGVRGWKQGTTHVPPG